MHILKEIKWQPVMCALIYIGIGIMLLLFPGTTAKTICYVAGGCAIVAGFVIVCIYLFRDMKHNAYRNDFVCGLLAILIGIFVIWKMELILGLIPFFMGIAVMVSGFIKLQSCIDIRRMGYGSGVGLFLLSVVSIICGIILITDPFSSGKVLSIIIGLSLIFSGISDTYTAIYVASKVKDYMNKEEKESNL